MSGIGRRWLQVDSNNCNVPEKQPGAMKSSFWPCLSELIESPGQSTFLRYSEDISRITWWFERRKYKPKVVIQSKNLVNPNQYFVRLFRSQMPRFLTKDAFYLGPLTKSTENRWYAPYAIGCNTLHNTISRICTAAGFRAFKNQSLPLGHISNSSLSSWCELTAHHWKDRSS